MNDPLPLKIYGNPKGSVHWNIEHKKYKFLPELQDQVFKIMHSLPKDIQNLFLIKYNRENVSLLLMLSPIETIKLEAELNNYIENGILP